MQKLNVDDFISGKPGTEKISQLGLKTEYKQSESEISVVGYS